MVFLTRRGSGDVGQLGERLPFRSFVNVRVVTGNRRALVAADVASDGLGYTGVLEQGRSRVSQRMESDFATRPRGASA